MENTNPESKKQKLKNLLHFEWVLPVFLKPRQTIEKINSDEKPNWLTPLLVVSVLIVLSVMIAAPIQRNTIQMGMNIPDDFQYYSEDQQTQFMNAQANRTSPLFLYVFPTLTGLASLWISWFLLSSLMHLSLTLAGSRASNLRYYNLAAWSFLPIGLRHVIQIFAMLFTKTVVSSPGFSGFIAADATGFAAFMAALLGLIDIYFIWQIILLLIGVVPLSGLLKSKAWSATAVSLLILILLQAVPGLLSSVVGGLSLTSSFYF